MKKLALLGLASAAVLAAACSDTTATSPASQLALNMASAFNSTPAGFSELTTSYATTGMEGAFAPMFDHGAPGGMMGGMMGGRDHGGPGFGLGFMGGGLEGAFLGDGMGREHFHADHANNCAFNASVGVTCTDTTRDGLIVKRVTKYTTAAGVVQSAIDSTTNTVATTVTVSGTAVRRDSSKSVVNESSTQTVTGLAKGSTQRTVNGASGGTENTTGTSREGAFTAARTTADTVKGVVIPAATSTIEHPYPTAGTVTRVMNATVTISGQSPTTTARKEVITYDGSATAKVVITLNGTTQNCTLPLPHGRLSCS